MLIRRGWRSIHRRWLGLGVHWRLAAEHVLAVVDQIQQVACLGFVPPAGKVFAADLATWIDIGTLANGHVGCGRNKGHGRLAGIVAWDPVRYRNIVSGTAKLDRNGALKGEQELCASIVEREDLRLGREGRDGDQSAIDIGKDTVAVSVGPEHSAQPSLDDSMVHSSCTAGRIQGKTSRTR